MRKRIGIEQRSGGNGSSTRKQQVKGWGDALSKALKVDLLRTSAFNDRVQYQVGGSFTRFSITGTTSAAKIFSLGACLRNTKRGSSGNGWRSVECYLDVNGLPR
ncbi:transcription elongation factor SPT6-like protein [Corchorus olitorius]|uniref:Transcription elongation factor SPT6-like protein n=1 Tax=Corchorus olitorius TaxID=93759 RepID=A0A1R3H4X3_9ROSI|nr:transcription elongation factor SPT6-like protein [Corchorus olitorius]